MKAFIRCYHFASGSLPWLFFPTVSTVQCKVCTANSNADFRWLWQICTNQSFLKFYYQSWVNWKVASSQNYRILVIIKLFSFPFKVLSSFLFSKIEGRPLTHKCVSWPKMILVVFRNSVVFADSDVGNFHPLLYWELNFKISRGLLFWLLPNFKRYEPYFFMINQRAQVKSFATSFWSLIIF